VRGGRGRGPRGEHHRGATGAAGERAGGHGGAPPGLCGECRRGATRGRARGPWGSGMGRTPGGRAVGKKKGRGRRRERELTSGSKSGDHRLQNLGHHGGERDGREGVVCGRVE
jgi:hypothetical protein